VTVHVGATGSELRDLYARASIYWHATGLGEDPERAPDRFEHFGITTVEAMSAGAVPVVIGHAGQLEVLDDGVQGYHWRDLDTLIERTERLAADPDLLARFADAAQERARDYGMDAFASRVSDLVDDTLRAPSESRVA
jgi:glycosyltransferase involved in cell wall biosynthesis